MRFALLLFVVTSMLMAQDTAASVGGVVKDAGTGEPIAGASVGLVIGVRMINGVMNQSKDMKRFSATTDSQGHYSFSDVPAGEGSISVALKPREMPSRSRTINMRAGQKLVYDLPVTRPGVIAGTITDENDEPVPGVSVFLVAREYHAGAIRNLIQSLARADDQGHYTLERVQPGRPYLVFADNRISKLDAISPVPEDPKMRRQAFAPVFYPNSRDIAGGSPLTLRSGQALDGINIKMTKAPAFCIDATLEMAGVPAPLAFDIALQQPSFGSGARGGFFSSNPGGIAGPDGKVRICDLTPGVYTLEGKNRMPQKTPGVPEMGTTTIVIGDRDLKGIKVEALGAQPISGEVLLEGPLPAEPIAGNVNISLNPLVRSHFMGEQMDARPSVPGTFTLASVPEGEYFFFPPSAPEGYFVKDITYAGVSVMHGTLRVGSVSASAGLRVIVAPGAGKMTVTVTDGKDKPAIAANAVAMPANAVSEAALAAGLVRCSTDQDGACTLYRIAPGKYHVMALSDEIDMTPEQVTRLLQARTTRAQVVEVGEGGTGQAQVKVLSLR